jgi:hypothetical protein
MTTYKIERLYRDHDRRDLIATGLTLEEAQAHCRCPETSSSTCTAGEGIARTDAMGPWFDSYQNEQ